MQYSGLNKICMFPNEAISVEDLPLCALYNPSEFQALTFHDAVPAFKEARDNPRDYLERCLATIEEREPVVRAWVEMNVVEARCSRRRFYKAIPGGTPAFYD